jgi:hypothetical protein
VFDITTYHIDADTLRKFVFGRSGPKLALYWFVYSTSHCVLRRKRFFLTQPSFIYVSTVVNPNNAFCIKFILCLCLMHVWWCHIRAVYRLQKPNRWLSWGVVFEEITRDSIQALSIRVSFVVSVCRLPAAIYTRWIHEFSLSLYLVEKARESVRISAACGNLH